MAAEAKDVRLRDFVYLDVERVKSLLSQIDKGLLTDRSDSVGSSLGTEGKAGIRLPLLAEIGGAGEYITTDQSTENRTLHDYVYNQTEEKLLEIGRVRRFADDSDIDHLVDERSRSELSPVEYVLVSGRAILYDYSNMAVIAKNINEIQLLLARLVSSSKLKGLTGQQRQKLLNEIEREVKPNLLDASFVKDLGRFFELFYQDRLIVKMQVSDRIPDVRFTGTLQESHLRDKMVDIRYKYGSAPQERWNIFDQIASVPTREPLPVAALTAHTNDLERAFHTIFEGIRPMESQFGAVYPEIAITPIAIYRE